jgi:hypothetical protein
MLPPCADTRQRRWRGWPTPLPTSLSKRASPPAASCWRACSACGACWTSSGGAPPLLLLAPPHLLLLLLPAGQRAQRRAPCACWWWTLWLTCAATWETTWGWGSWRGAPSCCSRSRRCSGGCRWWVLALVGAGAVKTASTQQAGGQLPPARRPMVGQCPIVCLTVACSPRCCRHPAGGTLTSLAWLYCWSTK